MSRRCSAAPRAARPARSGQPPPAAEVPLLRRRGRGHQPQVGGQMIENTGNITGASPQPGGGCVPGPGKPHRQREQRGVRP